MKIYRISQNIEEEISKKSKESTVATIVLYDNHALILKRGSSAPWMPNKWNLPGGGVNNGESLESAALRECKEETGLNIYNLSPLKSFNDPDFSLKVFTAKTNNKNANLNFENSHYTWVNNLTYSKYDYVPYIQECLAIVLS